MIRPAMIASPSNQGGGNGGVHEQSRLASTPQASFEPAELAIVLSHYEMGVIDTVLPFRGGSRASPKLIIKAEKGTFLLKRRAKGRDDPAKVACAHQIQQHLFQLGFPLPRLVLTERHRASLVQLDGRVYEVFEFVKGHPYDGSIAATTDAGRTLAQLHRLLANFTPSWSPPSGSYHRLPRLVEMIASLPERLSDAAMTPVTDALRAAYLDAAARADRAGLPEWPRQLIHGDWHPGNMLFAGGKVAAAFDYDTVRLQPRAIDLANGLLQFSITRGHAAAPGPVGPLGPPGPGAPAPVEDPGRWPDHADAARFRAFFQGYDSTKECVVSRAEAEAIPWLMIEALIVESVVPVSTTGRFGVLEGGPFIRMVERKIRWLQANAAHLVQSVV